MKPAKDQNFTIRIFPDKDKRLILTINSANILARKKHFDWIFLI